MSKPLALAKHHLRLAFEGVPDNDKHMAELKEVIRLTLGFAEAMEPEAPRTDAVIVNLADYSERAAAMVLAVGKK